MDKLGITFRHVYRQYYVWLYFGYSKLDFNMSCIFVKVELLKSMTYSIDFREAVLSHIDSGTSIESTSILFSIGTTTIKNWKRLRATTGKLAGSGRPCSPYKIDSDKLKAYAKDHPDAFLNEIAEHFGVTSPAIHAAMKRLNITRKKKSLLYESSTRDDLTFALRKGYKRQIAHLQH